MTESSTSSRRCLDPTLPCSPAVTTPNRRTRGLPVLWHQDAAYWPLEPMDVITVWLALDDSGPTNGCVRVIPGSHRWKVYPTRDRDDIANAMESEVDIDEALIHETTAVDLVVPAGGMSLHHPVLVHDSYANTSGRWRRGLTIRYIPATTRILGSSAESPWPCAFLLRGEAQPGINFYLPRPAYVEGRHYAFRGCERWASQSLDRGDQAAPSPGRRLLDDSECSDDVQRLAAELAAARQTESELRRELERLRNTKTFRWTRLARNLYGQLLQRSV